MAPAPGGPGKVRGRAAAGVFMVPRSPRPGRYIHACFRTRGARVGRATPMKAAVGKKRGAPGGRTATDAGTGLPNRCPVAGVRRRECGTRLSFAGPRSAASGCPSAVTPVPLVGCVRELYPVPVFGTRSRCSLLRGRYQAIPRGNGYGWTRFSTVGAQRSAPGSIFQPLPSYRGGAEGPHGPVPPSGASPRPRPNNGERRSRGTSYGAAGAAAAPGLSVTARISPAGGCSPAPCPENGRRGGGDTTRGGGGGGGNRQPPPPPATPRHARSRRPAYTFYRSRETGRVWESSRYEEEQVPG